MGRYLIFCSGSVNKTIKSYCKILYLMSILKKCPQLTKNYNLIKLSSQTLTRTRKPTLLCGLFYHSGQNSSFHGHVRVARHHKGVRFYSSSSRDEFKAEAPVGILEDSQDSQLSRLRGHLGQSFYQLSSHINMYFKRKNIARATKNNNPEPVEHVSKAPIQNDQRMGYTIPQNTFTKETCDDKIGRPSKQDTLDSQLFHTSSLATRFGESYSYVAKHINSVFSRAGTKDKLQGNLDMFSKSEPKTKERKMDKSGSDVGNPFLKANVNQITDQNNARSNSWEEGYALFSAHINKYFGAKVTDKKKSGGKYQLHPSKRLPTKPSMQSQSPTFELKDELDGLFHQSRNTTHFGESYFQMANHINQYFKGETEVENYIDEGVREIDPAFVNSDKYKTFSIMDCLLHPSSAIPDFLNTYLKPSTKINQPSPTMTSPRTTWHKNQYLNQKWVVKSTYDLIGSLEQTSSPETLMSCIEALNEHLIRYPACKMLLWQKKTAVSLLRKRRTYINHKGLQGAIRETLALVGYVDAVKGRGIRVLSIDGGGTRGVVPLQVLKILEVETGKKIHQLFDYICGVSTGAVLAFMLGLARFSLGECEDMYRRFGSEVFRQNPFVGTMKMGWSHSYYSTETWETILREKVGERVLIKTARDEQSPKVSAVSAVVNWGTSPKAFVFRNYNHSPGSLSRYAGGSGYQMWQAVRASSAAPGYFQEFTLQGDIHQDGGIILNNPCALAVHESRLLWPNQPFQCVLSLGTGRYDNVKRTPATSTTLRAKISNLISSATDTEGVHTLLDDLLAPNVYFRFNPMLSAEVSLDESRPGAMDMLLQDTQFYLERNRPKLARLCLVLGAERSAVSKTMDWVGERAWGMRQSWL